MYVETTYMEFDFSKVIGFDWDAGNLTKNPQKHRISDEEAEEIFFRDPWVMAAARPEDREPRWAVLGRGAGGRVLRIIFTVRGQKLRVISARRANKKEIADYAEALRERSES